MSPAGIYIHIPFCQVRCSYCDFNTYAGLSHLVGDYVVALCREIGSWATAHGPAPAATIYLGGGTPSLLSCQHLGEILAACRAAFTLSPDAEITIEANPGTVTLHSLEQMRHLGINRLSLGVQSFDDAMLRRLDRLHDAATARQAYAAARSAGFHTISLDFMYGLPGQTLEHWQQTLEQAVALAPDHLSLYALTLEAETPMAQRVAAGELSLPDDDSLADMYTLAEDLLEQAGYVHYEISNWGRAQQGASAYSASQHNLIYWRRLPYLGFGAGAHSFIGQERYSNVLHPHDYIARIAAQGSAVAARETITARMAMAETMFLGLRLIQEGVSDENFVARHGRTLDVFAPQINELIALGLLERSATRLRLTRRGRLLSNQVFVRFLG